MSNGSKKKAQLPARRGGLGRGLGALIPSGPLPGGSSGKGHFWNALDNPPAVDESTVQSLITGAPKADGKPNAADAAGESAGQRIDSTPSVEADADSGPSASRGSAVDIHVDIDDSAVGTRDENLDVVAPSDAPQETGPSEATSSDSADRNDESQEARSGGHAEASASIEMSDGANDPVDVGSVEESTHAEALGEDGTTTELSVDTNSSEAVRSTASQESSSATGLVGRDGDPENPDHVSRETVVSGTDRHVGPVDTDSSQAASPSAGLGSSSGDGTTGRNKDAAILDHVSRETGESVTLLAGTAAAHSSTARQVDDHPETSSNNGAAVRDGASEALDDVSRETGESATEATDNPETDQGVDRALATEAGIETTASGRAVSSTGSNQEPAGDAATEQDIADHDPAGAESNAAETGAADATGEEQSHDVDPSGAPAVLVEISPDEIRANPKNPRQVFDDDELAELAESIKEFGLLQPIVVREQADGYELVMGERRLRASKLAGIDTIPVIVRQTEDDEMLRDALLENIHRVQLHPLEEAAAYQQLIDEFGVTHEELALRIKRSRPVISNTIRLLKLPTRVQNRVAAGVISGSHARALLSLDDSDAQEALATRIVAEGLSVRATEEAVALHAGDDHSKGRAVRRKRPVAPALGALAERLSDHFDTRALVQLGRSKGKIVVEFASVDDLERIIAMMAPPLATQRLTAPANGGQAQSGAGAGDSASPADE